MAQTVMGGLRSNQQNYQQCFIGHSQRAPWRKTFELVCEEVLPNFDLKPWYADKQFRGSVPLRQKVVDMIATTRYGIYDLSYWRENDQSVWIMPRNVLIELGMAIALNRPMLLLRHGKNRECGLTLPACLEGISIGEFGDGKKLLKKTLNACLPSLTQHTPKQDWLNRYCHFGGLECSSREAHPQAQQWGRQKIHIHISDGVNATYIDCSDFRDMIEEEVIYRFNDLEFNYLDSSTCPQECKFLLCSRCQEVRSSPFAIYRIMPHTSADTFIAIGMSIAMEKQFNYAITKILVTDDKNNIPSLLEGYEIIVERNYTKIKDRLNSILPEMIEKTRQTTWKPRPLPFEVSLPAEKHTEPEETTSIEEDLENENQVLEDSSSQQGTERDWDIDQVGRKLAGDSFDKFTAQAKMVLNLAKEEAQRFQHNYIGTEHLILGIVRESEGVAAKVLANLGIELNKVRSAVEFIMGRGDRIVLGEMRLTPRAEKVIELAVDESRRMNHNYVGTEHLLLGLVREGEGIAAGVLESLDVTLEKVRTQTIQVLSQASVPATVDINQQTARNNPVSIFISYAVEDKVLCQKLEKHLTVLERDGLLEIEHGSKTEIHSMKDYDIMLHNSKLLFPLISPDYLISQDGIINHFMDEYMHDESDVIPIILRPTGWKNTPFAHLKSLPTNGVPVTQWPSRDEAFFDAVQGIRRAIEEWQERQ